MFERWRQENLFKFPRQQYALDALANHEVIGSDITTAAVPHLPASASCGSDERIVRIPRKTLVRARPDIPEA